MILSLLQIGQIMTSLHIHADLSNTLTSLDTFYSIQFFYIYENNPIQIICKCFHQQMKIFKLKNSGVLHISTQNIDCGYLLEPPW